MGKYRAQIAQARAFPYLPVNFFKRENPVRVFYKEHQQGKLRRGKERFFRSPAERMAGCKERQIPAKRDLHFAKALQAILPRPAQNRLDARLQHRITEGFGQIIVPSELHRPHNRLIIRQAADKNNRAVGRLAQLCAELDPVLARQDDIHQNQVERLLLQAQKRRLRIMGNHRLIPAGKSQVFPQYFAVFQVILH